MKLKYIIAAFILACTGVSCDSQLETFEMPDDAYIGTPDSVGEITSEALPGQIRLVWNIPEDADFTYMKIWYEDPLLKKTVYKIVSKGTTEMLIDGTRARFGEYEFFFQTFNSNNEGGEVRSVRAVSGIAPATYSLKKYNLTADMLSTNAQEPTERPIANLVDGNSGSFFHTRWSSPLIALPHYIQIDFTEPHQDFVINYVNRTDNTWTTDGRPSKVELQVSDDGQVWETVVTLSDLPIGAGSEYTSDYVLPGRTFTSFRFNVIEASGNTSYFNLGEFSFSDLEIYDPETVELD